MKKQRIEGQLPLGTGFGSCFGRGRAELSAGTRVALEMLPGSPRARKIKKKKRNLRRKEILLARNHL